MENLKSEVTAPVVETKAEEMIPQSQVGGIVAKETKIAIEKMLKDLGVEDFKSAKEGLSKFKEIQDAQKTEAEKIKEEINDYKTKYETVSNQNKSIKIELGAKDILGELNIDTKHLKTILKLADLSGVYEEDLDTVKLKEVITKIVDEELPMLKTSDRVKVGTEKSADAPQVGGTMEYLAKKYANNPYFKK